MNINPKTKAVPLKSQGLHINLGLALQALWVQQGTELMGLVRRNESRERTTLMWQKDWVQKEDRVQLQNMKPNKPWVEFRRVQMFWDPKCSSENPAAPRGKMERR